MSTETRTTETQENEADYLDAEINILKPATPFMRDHLKVLWAAFVVWVLFVFGPVTATIVAPEFMTGTIVLGFQLHYLLTALVAPLGALLLSVAYARQRERLDEKYGISHSTEEGRPSGATATDGGADE